MYCPPTPVCCYARIILLRATGKQSERLQRGRRATRPRQTKKKQTAPKTKKKPDPKTRRDPEVGRDPHPDSYTSYIPYIYIYIPGQLGWPFLIQDLQGTALGSSAIHIQIHIHHISTRVSINLSVTHQDMTWRGFMHSVLLLGLASTLHNSAGAPEITNCAWRKN